MNPPHQELVQVGYHRSGLSSRGTLYHGLMAFVWPPALVRVAPYPGQGGACGNALYSRELCHLLVRTVPQDCVSSPDAWMPSHTLHFFMHAWECVYRHVCVCACIRVRGLVGRGGLIDSIETFNSLLNMWVLWHKVFLSGKKKKRVCNDWICSPPSGCSLCWCAIVHSNIFFDTSHLLFRSRRRPFICTDCSAHHPSTSVVHCGQSPADWRSPHRLLMAACSHGAGHSLCTQCLHLWATVRIPDHSQSCTANNHRIPSDLRCRLEPCRTNTPGGPISAECRRWRWSDGQRRLF